jgi:hypothetical protein
MVGPTGNVETLPGNNMAIGKKITISTTAPTGSARQYCYTSQEIRTKNKEQVSSETLVKCSDDHVDRITIKKAGVAKNCGDYTYYVTLNGRSVEQRGLACEKFNGTWEIIPNAGYR